MNVKALVTALVGCFKGNKQVSFEMTPDESTIVVTAQSGFFNQTSKKTLKDDQGNVLVKFEEADTFEATMTADQLVSYCLRGLWVNRLAPQVKEGKIKPSKLANGSQLIRLDATTKDGGATKQLREEVSKTKGMLRQEARNMLRMLGVAAHKITDQVVEEYLVIEDFDAKTEFIKKLK